MAVQQEQVRNRLSPLSDPELAHLSADDMLSLVVKRIHGLFAGKATPRDYRYRPPQVTRSERGTDRMRASFLGVDTEGIENVEDAYYAGIVTPDNDGRVYMESYSPYPTKRTQEVYQINTVHPNNSVAYQWRGEAPVEIPIDRAMRNVAHMLGRFANAHITNDYDGAWMTEPHQFAHPDLQGDQLRKTP